MPTDETQEMLSPSEVVALAVPSVDTSEVLTPSSLPEETVTTNQTNDEVVTDETLAEGSVSEAAPPKRRARTASAVTRTKKPRSTGPKPSQRGFKWPTQE